VILSLLAIGGTGYVVEGLRIGLAATDRGSAAQCFAGGFGDRLKDFPA